jgi:hypothetical protein
VSRSAAALAFFTVLFPTVARATPITFHAPLPLEDDQVAVGSQGALVAAPDGPDPENADERVVSIAAVAMSALFPRVTLAVAVPYIDRRIEARGPRGDQIARRARGAGDVTTSLALTAARRGALVFAPFVSVKTPTGTSDEADELGRLPQRLQVGTGAWDAAAGGLVSWQASEVELDAALSYLLRTEAHDFDAGDEIRAELSAHRAVPGAGRRLVGALESHVVWQAPDRGALAPAESGGTSVYLCPGLQANLGRHTIDAAAEVPLVQPSDQHVAIAARLGYRLVLDR